MRQLCGRLLVGQGTDTWDPICGQPEGHTGPCKPHPETVHVVCSQWASCGWKGRRRSDRIRSKSCPRCDRDTVVRM